MIQQPNAILGNSRILVTIGSRGELLAFFYPRIDYAQNIEESLAGVYSEGRMLWVNEEWESRQVYLEDLNILHTNLHHPLGIYIEIEDMVLPEGAVLVRRFKISTCRNLKAKFFYYLNFTIGEHRTKNSGFCDPSGIIMHYWQNINIGLASNPSFEEWQIGKAIDTAWWTNAKLDSEDGFLRGNREEIGYVNASVSWKLDLTPECKMEIILFLAAASNRFNLKKEIQRIKEIPYEELQTQTKNHWLQWLSRARELKLKEYQSIYKRSLLVLSLLRDKQFGSFIAAPEFDHFYEKSGGYGYCWNRDATHMALALDAAGYIEAGEAFAAWCRKMQLEDGSWFQRYWVNGELAPSWGNFDFSTQLDQVGCTLHFYLEHARYLPDKLGYFQSIWKSVERGAEYIMRRTERGLHDICVDLWESHFGSFTYTNAALYRGLLSAAEIASAVGEKNLAEKWRARAMLIKQELLNKFWLKEGYFARGIINGKLDKTYDASFLGLLEPFELLDLRNNEERSMLEQAILLIEKKLGIYVNEGIGIKRFEGDEYIGGNPWTITTLWYAIVLLKLASFYLNSDQDKADHYFKKAVACMEWCQRGSTSTGLLPEQVDRFTGKPTWATPIGWAHALVIKCLLLMEELKFRKLEIGKLEIRNQN
ncbi:MAG: glycoside hydrolase family 15 protein [Methanocellales archaeon]